MVSCETAGCIVLLESTKLSTSAAADDDDGGTDGYLGTLGRSFIAGRNLVYEGTRPPNLVVYEQMDLSHDKFD